MDRSRERTRREFLRDMAALTFGSAAAASSQSCQAAVAKGPDLVVASGEVPKALVRRAVAELGGMKRFVSRGDVVVVKPNMGWVRRPDQAANTNPDVVVGLIEMAFEAGAKEVNVFDQTVQGFQKTYAACGIPEPARQAGARVHYQDQMATTRVTLKDAVHLEELRIAKIALECDCYINAPIAKHHGSTILTLAMKNHMGLSFEDNQKLWHPNLHQAIADFANFFRPHLTILDAYRILPRHGPAGGNLADVEFARKCIAGVDQVAVDAYGTTLFPALVKKPTDVAHIALAGRMGVGETDLSKLQIKEIRVETAS